MKKTCDCGCEHELCTSRIGLLKVLPPAKQQQLTATAKHYERPRGTVLFREHEPFSALLIIRAGRIKLNRYDAEGKEFILDIRTEGDTIGEDLLFASDTAPYNAVCVTAAALCELPQSEMLALVKREPEVAWNVIRDLSTRLGQAGGMLEILQENDAERRLIRFLLSRHQRTPDHEITLSLEDIAASVGLRGETVSRKLRDLQSQGLISRRGQRSLRLLQPDALKNLIESL